MNNTTYQEIITALLNPKLENQKDQKTAKAQKYLIINEQLWRRPTRRHGIQRTIREQDVDRILKLNHDELGHQGITTTWERISQHYYWPQQFESIRNYVSSCDTCQQRKDKPQALPLEPIPVTQNMVKIGIDFVGPLPLTKQGN